MNFNSIQYALFLPVAVAGYFLFPKKLRNYFLLVASYYFYMCWVPEYVVLIAFSTFVTWLTGFLVDRQSSPSLRKLALAINLIVNLGILFVFKYFNFFTNGISAILAPMGVSLPFGHSDLLLPVGISFYTFQALGYSMDVYRRDVPHEKNFFTYALFVSFFPQLVAGPIERTGHLMPQLKDTGRKFSPALAGEGCRILLLGIFKKVVCADLCALYVNTVFGDVAGYSGPALLLALLMFALQIYCDFSAYSEIAKGSALLFGIRLMDNFRAPYLSCSITEFWSRWHISLSTWFRDYLYIPLGGNRKGFFRKCVNLMVVFAVSGLWHGAAATYVVWGALHGVFRVAEEVMHRWRAPQTAGSGARWRLKVTAKTLVCFTATCFAWVFFRADTLSQAGAFFSGLLSGWDLGALADTVYNVYSLFIPAGGIPSLWILLFVGAVLFSFVFVFVNDYQLKYRFLEPQSIFLRRRTMVRWAMYYLFFFATMFYFVLENGGFGQAIQFIYFQF